MKSRYILLILSLFTLVISDVADSSVFYTSQIIHSQAELGKVCLNPDGTNTILSKSTQDQGITFISKILGGKRFEYKQSQFNLGYDISEILMPTKNMNGENAYTLYHKSNGREYLTELKEKGENIISKEFYSYHALASALSLKNGVVFFAGINAPQSKYAQTTIDIKTYNPQTRTELNSGFTLSASSHLISCAEINDNEVYCAYIDEETLTKRHLLKLQYFRVTESGAIYHENSPYLIKAFYTDFNMIKLVKISSNEVGIVFQTGNGGEFEAIPYGNTGKDLYFYHLKVSPNSFQVVRYDYIYNNCRLRTNYEDYTVDIIAVQNIAYVICEVDNEPDAFQLIKISPLPKQFEQTKINNLGKEIKNPQFVLMGNTIGILYTRIDSNNVKDVMLLMVNYPDCEDSTNTLVIYPECPYGINQLTTKMEPYFKIFISNPYLKYTNEPLYYRIVNSNNIKIFNGNSELLTNQDYALSTLSSIYIAEFEENQENTYIEYTVVRKESGNAILGGTCRINVEVPKCWEGCKGCEPEGNDIDNRCFDCKNGYHYIPTGKDSSGLGCGKDGKIYNCDRCDIACTECFGPFDEKYPTTNCNYSKCNFDKGYFPLEYNTTICFNESDKDEWEDKLNLKCTLFLDKSQGSKEKWVWTCCDPHCASCHLRNTTDNDNCDTCKTSEGFFFYLNQTTAGGIPGNCHESCVGEGCYQCKDEGMEKMCPCLDHCKVCKNKDTCDECWRTWLLHPEKTSCDGDCDYCYTPYFEKPETKENGRCVNCKTDFDPPQYTFNGKCYTKKPTFQYKAIKPVNERYDNKTFIIKTVDREYHVIDEKCNLLTGCKEGCKKCDKLESDRCTECEDGYYKEDGKEGTFECYSKKVCRGNFPYPHDKVDDESEIKIRIGGVDYIEEDGTLVCLNCKYRNESFRQPEDEYWCGPNRSMTYVDIEPYNKLSKCYVRCKTCDKAGYECAMACTSCRDSKYYDLIKYDKTHGQCYRKQHKCGIYPYWHNYELAEDEDDCGEDCDVCLYNFQCPKEFPYFKFETHECVEFCPATDVLAGNCNVNSSAVLLYLLKNPFGLRNPYEKLNREIYLHQLIASDIGKYLQKVYPEIDLTNIFNYIGCGKVYNLPESKIIVGNNISIELTSVKLELEKIADYLNGGNPPSERPYTPTGLDLSACENILKKKYNLPAEEDLVIVKADFPVLLKDANITYQELFGNNPDYQIFSISLGAFLPLSACSESEDEGGYSVVYNPFQNTHIIESFQSKIGVVVSNGYDIFNANSPFYNDVCTPFTNENGNDVLLDARRQDYFEENINLCDKGCAFIGYNTNSKTYICKCNIKSTPGEDTGEFKGEIVERVMPENFKDLISRRSNIAVFKCASQVFSAEGQKGNYGSYILLAATAAFIGVLVFHFVKEKGKSMYILYNQIARGERIISNPPKGDKNKKEENKNNEKKEKNNDKTNKGNKKEKKGKVSDAKKIYDDFLNSENRQKVSNKVVDVVLEEDQLNFASYNDVIGKDYRSLLQTYWSFLKFKQPVIFTFYTRSDGILRSTKIALFILFFAFYMAFTALFFNDDIMRALYIYKGNTNAAVHVPNIVLSSLCSFIASLIVRYVCLGERDIAKITSVTNLEERKKLAKRARKIAMIKLIVLYLVSGILLLLCWYYVSAFCAVFKNSQKNYLINFIICFIVCNLWPVLTSFIPATMRRCALDDNKECLYKASQIVSVF